MFKKYVISVVCVLALSACGGGGGGGGSQDYVAGIGRCGPQLPGNGPVSPTPPGYVPRCEDENNRFGDLSATWNPPGVYPQAVDAASGETYTQMPDGTKVFAAYTTKGDVTGLMVNELSRRNFYVGHSAIGPGDDEGFNVPETDNHVVVDLVNPQAMIQPAYLRLFVADNGDIAGPHFALLGQTTPCEPLVWEAGWTEWAEVCFFGEVPDELRGAYTHSGLTYFSAHYRYDPAQGKVLARTNAISGVQKPFKTIDVRHIPSFAFPGRGVDANFPDTFLVLQLCYANAVGEYCQLMKYGVGGNYGQQPVDFP